MVNYLLIAVINQCCRAIKILAFDFFEECKFLVGSEMNAECINQKQNAWKNAVNAVAHLCGIDDIIVHGII